MSTILRKKAELKLKLVGACPSGLEDVMCKEWKSLGVHARQERRAVIVDSATLADYYRLVVWSRVATRIAIELQTFPSRGLEDPYKITRQIDWTEVFDVKAAISCEALSANPKLPRQWFNLRIKDAIADHFNQVKGSRPDVDRHQPDIEIILHIDQERAAFLLDPCGAPIHRRLYRQEAGIAPLRETVAAAILLWAECWKAKTVFDPFCGSGTFPIEASWIAHQVQPSLLIAHLGLEHWRWHDDRLYRKVCSEPRDAVNAEQVIIASDIDPAMVRIAKSNSERAKAEKTISFSEQNALVAPRCGDSGLIVANLPYGERMEQDRALHTLYRDFYKHMVQEFDGWDLVLLSSNLDALNSLGPKADRTLKFRNGTLPTDARLYRL